ncbi:MAG: putative cadmium/zinc-transporting ATPase HMA1,chloroplastic [Chlamydiota bacterium]|jgi:heavy metal translocating P-type ATPase
MRPYFFDEFFASGLEESVSPFLTTTSRNWGRNLGLKSASFAAGLLAFALGTSFIDPAASHLLIAAVYFIVGTPALIASLNDLKNLEVNIDVLMTLAAFIAVAIGSALEGGLLLVLFGLSHGLEAMVSKKAKAALHNLNHLAPKFALIVDSDGSLYEKSVREISVGNQILIKNGEIVPLDGIVIEGVSSVNLVHLTGESLPQSIGPGALVPAGATNLEGAITIEVRRTSSDSTLSRIVKLISEAQEAKPALQRWLDRFGKPYASSIIGLTFLFAVGLPMVMSIDYFGVEGSIYRSLAFLIAASPCALIIATPTAYLSAISACARKGILLKGGVILDAIASCRAVAFDKTGTLTTGQLACVGIEPVGDAKHTAAEALAAALALERNVTHPIAVAIDAKAKEMGVAPAMITHFQSIPGFGLKANLDGEAVEIGSFRDSCMENVLSQVVAKAQAEEQLISILRLGSDVFLFRFTDQIRPESTLLLRKLKAKKMHAVMLTGDHQINAQKVAKTLGMTDVFSELKPEDKLQKVADLSYKEGLAMVGDGINDAPALARATVGISMGKIGSATAVDASDVVLLNDDLMSIDWLFDKAHMTRRIVKQNLTVALGVIFLATTPALLGLVPLWIAVLLHEGGTVLVGMNSLRLLYKR